ncbi:MAG: AraC family transcriptional regulator [Pseudomonadales bacterium]|nr:AraC family transcriptional regulator [Pseudomonadales bacterium]
MARMDLMEQMENHLATLPAWTRQPTQSVTYPKAFVEAAVAAGASQELVLRTAGIATTELDDPAGRVSLQAVMRIAASVLEHTGDDNLGFASGQRMPLTAHGSLGYALMCADTPRHAIRILEKYWHLRGRGALFAVDEQTRRVFLELVPEVDAPARVQQLLFSSMLTSMFRGIEFLLPQAPITVEFWLQHDTSATFDPGIPSLPAVRFGMPRVGMALDGDLAILDTPLQTANPEALRTALAQCERESVLIAAGSDVLRRVRTALVPGREGYLSPEGLANALHMTPRTLRRRLQEQGYSYQQLLEEARRRDSAQLLRDPELEIRRIGEMLGYLNPANFTRAFKRWTGLSPREWRRQLGNEAG